MTKGALAAILLILCWPVAGQQSQPAAKSDQTLVGSIPIEAKQKTNPMKSTAESITRGKHQFGIDCAMCHGKEGNGKGDVSTDMKLKMMDFTDPNTLKDRTDGELFYIIKNGHGDMPPEGDRVKPELDWDMVNYVRSLSKKKLPDEKPAGEEKPEEPKSPS
jgi:mono/diheme cytochrome c family protein